MQAMSQIGVGAKKYSWFDCLVNGFHPPVSLTPPPPSSCSDRNICAGHFLLLLLHFSPAGWCRPEKNHSAPLVVLIFMERFLLNVPRSLNELRVLLLESHRHSRDMEKDLNREVHKAEWKVKEQKLQDDIKSLREKLLLLVRTRLAVYTSSYFLHAYSSPIPDGGSRRSDVNLSSERKPQTSTNPNWCSHGLCVSYCLPASRLPGPGTLFARSPALLHAGPVGAGLGDEPPPAAAAQHRGRPEERPGTQPASRPAGPGHAAASGQEPGNLQSHSLCVLRL